jgi:hypothetical protein
LHSIANTNAEPRNPRGFLRFRRKRGSILEANEAHPHLWREGIAQDTLETATRGTGKFQHLILLSRGFTEVAAEI